jgi:hypothetical protein
VDSCCSSRITGRDLHGRNRMAGDNTTPAMGKTPLGSLRALWGVHPIDRLRPSSDNRSDLWHAVAETGIAKIAPEFGIQQKRKMTRRSQRFVAWLQEQRRPSLRAMPPCGTRHLRWKRQIAALDLETFCVNCVRTGTGARWPWRLPVGHCNGAWSFQSRSYSHTALFLLRTHGFCL